MAQCPHCFEEKKLFSLRCPNCNSDVLFKHQVLHSTAMFLIQAVLWSLVLIVGYMLLT